MLSSVLPGVREVRTPLAAGYVWLINVWLVFAGHLPVARPAIGPVARLWDLGIYAGKGAVLVAATFAAYLVGALLEINPHHLWEYGGRPRWITKLRNFLRKGWFSRVRVLPVSARAQQDLLAFTTEEYGFVADDPHPLYVPHSIMQEERQLTTRLQAANVDLFNRYDRLLAESAFRLNATPPLIILALLVIWQTVPSAGLSVLAISVTLLVGATLIRQGVVRAIQSRDIIAQAVVAGVVRSRFLDRLRDESFTSQKTDNEVRNDMAAASRANPAEMVSKLG